MDLRGLETYGYTNEYYGDSTQLMYLRSRYYASNTGRFLTRDTWMGEYGSPLSLNRWNYVEGNPINLTDPSGMCAKGRCGPDLTDWVKGQIQVHYDYGLRIRNQIARMKLLAQIHFNENCTFPSVLLNPIYLKDIAIEQPLQDIVYQMTNNLNLDFPGTNVSIARTTPIYPFTAVPIIDALGLFEYALYGLAVDYSSVDYPRAPTCNTSGCDTFGSKEHQTITLCNKCIDVSDLGNLMFGLGGAARGYSLQFAYGSATLFNGLDDKSIITMLGVDPRGAIAGWHIGNSHAFITQSGFCSAIANSGSTMWNENGPELNSNCEACNTGPITLPNVGSPSSLNTISSGYSTVQWLKTLIPGL